jgi:hypothetical protein
MPPRLKKASRRSQVLARNLEWLTGPNERVVQGESCRWPGRAKKLSLGDLDLVATGQVCFMRVAVWRRSHPFSEGRQ